MDFVWIFIAFMAGGVVGMTAMALVVMGRQSRDEIKGYRGQDVRNENGKIVRGDASAEQRDYRNELALLCSWLRELAEEHPGCVNCMKVETTVEPGKYCPDCGRRRRSHD